MQNEQTKTVKRVISRTISWSIPAFSVTLLKSFLAERDCGSRKCNDEMKKNRVASREGVHFA